MRLLRRLLGVALLGAGVAYLRGRRKALAMARGADASARARFGTSAAIDDNLAEIATTSGIADIDPEPLAYITAEGVDPVRELAAHGDIRAVRDRLPRR